MNTTESDVAVWHGCYDDRWNDLIVPAAFAHPAKMARGLVARIFSELIAGGWLKPGDTIVDPFGGIGTTAIEGASRGMRVICNELEPKFVALALDNFALHRRDWQAMGRPQPIMVLGDSRDLRQVLAMHAAIDAVVSSPPYEESDQNYAAGRNRIDWEKGTRAGMKNDRVCSVDACYGDTPGQLGVMRGGHGVAAVVSSPPFTQGYSGGGGINVKGYGADGADKVGSRTYQGTGNDRVEGNLETLTLGEVDAVVTSPPYMGEAARPSGIDSSKFAPGIKSGGPNSQASNAGYGDTDGQLGGLRNDETFWSAAKQIVAESFAILRPGGTAVWVVKAFVRDKKLVDFPGDWRKLCEHVGFKMILEAHASLVHEEIRPHLFDGDVVKRRERKSFFRRLAEKKGSPRIDYEVVLIMRKPA